MDPPSTTTPPRDGWINQTIVLSSDEGRAPEDDDGESAWNDSISKIARTSAAQQPTAATEAKIPPTVIEYKSKPLGSSQRRNSSHSLHKQHHHHHTSLSGSNHQRTDPTTPKSAAHRRRSYHSIKQQQQQQQPPPQLPHPPPVATTTPGGNSHAVTPKRKTTSVRPAPQPAGAGLEAPSVLRASMQSKQSSSKNSRQQFSSSMHSSTPSQLHLLLHPSSPEQVVDQYAVPAVDPQLLHACRVLQQHIEKQPVELQCTDWIQNLSTALEPALLILQQQQPPATGSSSSQSNLLCTPETAPLTPDLWDMDAGPVAQNPFELYGSRLHPKGSKDGKQNPKTTSREPDGLEPSEVLPAEPPASSSSHSPNQRGKEVSASTSESSSALPPASKPAMVEKGTQTITREEQRPPQNDLVETLKRSTSTAALSSKASHSMASSTSTADKKASKPTSTSSLQPYVAPANPNPDACDPPPSSILDALRSPHPQLLRMDQLLLLWRIAQDGQVAENDTTTIHWGQVLLYGGMHRLLWQFETLVSSAASNVAAAESQTLALPSSQRQKPRISSSPRTLTTTATLIVTSIGIAYWTTAFLQMSMTSSALASATDQALGVILQAVELLQTNEITVTPCGIILGPHDTIKAAIMALTALWDEYFVKQLQLARRAGNEPTTTKRRLSSKQQRLLSQFLTLLTANPSGVATTQSSGADGQRENSHSSDSDADKAKSKEPKQEPQEKDRNVRRWKRLLQKVRTELNPDHVSDSSSFELEGADGQPHNGGSILARLQGQPDFGMD